MDIVNKYTGEVFKVYETIIDYDDRIQFLIYDAHDGWILVDAKHFKPYINLIG